MYEYKERIQHCRECRDNKFPLEHSLYHQTGLSTKVIHELNLTTVQDIKEAFQNSKQLDSCFISLDGRKTKIRDGEKFLFSQDIIELIPGFYFEDSLN